MQTKCYVWVLKQLSPTDKGIQMAHTITEMAREFGANWLLAQWADQDKTIVLLDGGNLGSIKRIWSDLITAFDDSDLPIGSFREDEESLGGLLTACCAVLPDDLFERIPFEGRERMSGRYNVGVEKYKLLCKMNEFTPILKHLDRATAK